ncbi:HD domain-containing protein [Candidatus Daviesbacteria bacterium]|nr:HD domain-containing protein [Candidatus Daviesbacteria bacterium]
MRIIDPVYGKFEIKEPVLIALIKSPSMQRLKKIKQHGLPKSDFIDFNRYEHSVGVMLLLKILDASLEEQIAGLLHDVSHTAFSHLVDWVIGDSSKENFQDKNHKRFIKASEIPHILEKFGFDVKKIVKIKSYSLLEQPSPNLCADRVDYGLREFHYWSNPKIVRYCLNNLTTFNQKMVFRDQKSAKIFAMNFLKLQIKHWGGKDTVLRYFLFSLILKDALKDNIISQKDLYQDDLFILKKLRESQNKKIKNLLNLLDKKLTYKINPKLPEIKINKKFRYVDPLYLSGKKVIHLSKVDLKFKQKIEKERELNKYGLRFNLIYSPNV